MRCSCPDVYLNSSDRESRGKNWSFTCLEHGVDSVWYNSPEQVAIREENTRKLIDIQRQASEARRNARQNRQST